MLKHEAVLRRELAGVGEFMVEALRKELRLQGHTLTGKLGRSIEAVVKKRVDEWTIDFLHEQYGAPVNRGVSAGRIPYSPGSGAGTSEYIKGLIRWVQLRGIAPGFAGAKKIAFAIAAKHKKEGMPTRGSYKFSNNGRRTGWIDHPASGQAQNISRKTEQAYEKYLDAVLDSHIQELARMFPGAIQAA